MKREHKNKSKCEFIITDKSKGLTVEDLQNMAFSLFGTPVRFPKENLKAMTLEEFVVGGTNEVQDEK